MQLNWSIFGATSHNDKAKNIATSKNKINVKATKSINTADTKN
jgi:hypothetical protein